MSIDFTKPHISNTTGNLRSSHSGTSGSTSATPSATTGAAASSDSVSLSTEAQKMVRLEQAATESSGVDNAKVEAMRTALANNSYSIDSNQLAGDILDHEDNY